MGHRDVPDSYNELIAEHELRWQERVGFRYAPIEFHHFRVDHPEQVTVYLLPADILEMLCDPYAGEDRYLTAKNFVEGWQNHRCYRMVWGSEQLDGVGYLISEGGHSGWDRELTVEEIAYYQPSGRTYTLRTHGDDAGDADFYTGRLPDGRPVILGPYNDHALLVMFYPDGRYRAHLTRDLPPGDKDPSDRTETRRRAKALARAWREELGLHLDPGPIRVGGFMLPDSRINQWDPYHHVYITDLPRWGLVYRYDPYFYPTKEERSEVAASLAAWKESGKFVFWWGKDYHMSRDGEVLST